MRWICGVGKMAKRKMLFHADIPYHPFGEAQSLTRAAEVIKYSGGI
jgi:hypothetical protein